MNILDILIAVVVGFCLVRGIFRGIIKELTSIVGVVAGFFVAYNYYSVVANLVSRLIVDKSYLNIVSFFLAFAIVFFAVGFLGVVLKHVFKAAALGLADRILGGIFGLVKAILIVSVLMVPLTAFLPEKSPLIKDSFLSPYVSIISEKIVVVVPKELKEKYDDNVNALREAWKKL